MDAAGLDAAVLRATRRSLHAVAELLIAGPQYREHGTIRLAVTPGGIGGTATPTRIDGTDLVWSGGRMPLRGSYADVAAAAGIALGAPVGVYADTSGVEGDEQLAVDPDAVALMLGWFAAGDDALRTFAPAVTPILWPEHFDLGIALDDVNYGVSPGDADSPRPYAYVGPWQPRTGAFWNASFGAWRHDGELPTAQSITDFFAEGRREAAS
ncbi:hypothetical protein [Antrihabitans cavernicola]|uniref:Uncharacterized protein n=1 Tax=Antrihabitans cavernicola TaxID=2495913 RepID=A0A5A7S9K3_9NOCA|nr:hypothetical protein [Spelaeibacter cavernicola]KAA0022858.1 hypothetical protein FOY51_10085 [Spelaeibacter cavernicola]